MGFNIKNNSWAQFRADMESAADEWLMENVWLLPTAFPYQVRVKRVDWSNNVIQQEIATVTNISWTTVSFTRATEECPKDETTNSFSQTAWKFFTWDIIEVIVTSDMLNTLAKDSEVVHNTWDETIAWDKTFSWTVAALDFEWDGSKLTWLSAEVQSASLKYMLWETLSAWLAMSLWDYEQLSVWTSNDVWSIAQPEVAQSFYAQSTDIVDINLMIKTISSPSDDILIEIQWDNAGVPDGVAVTNWTSNVINYTALSATFTEETFTFASIPTLTAETLYHIVIKRSGANDAVNYYAAESAWSDVQIGTASLNTGSRANATDDLYFKLTAWYKLITKWGTNFIWILQIAWVIWAIWKVNTWYDKNQTGLIIWNYYTYNKTTWILELWKDFKAISETEINLLEKEIFITAFWDWSDWDVTINSWTTTLVRDMYYDNLTVTSPWILNPNWYKVYVKWILSWDGTIRRNWNNASTTTWGVALNQWSLNADLWWRNGLWRYGQWLAWYDSNPSYTIINWAAWGDNAGGTYFWGDGWIATRSTAYNIAYAAAEELIWLLNPASNLWSITQCKWPAWSWSWGSGGWLWDTSGGAWWNAWVIWFSVKEINFTWTFEAIWGIWWDGASWGAGWGWGQWWVIYLISSLFTSIWTHTLTWWAAWTPWTPAPEAWNTWITIQITI